jgi:hypothetical protein
VFRFVLDFVVFRVLGGILTLLVWLLLLWNKRAWLLLRQWRWRRRLLWGKRVSS